MLSDNNYKIVVMTTDLTRRMCH